MAAIRFPIGGRYRYFGSPYRQNTPSPKEPEQEAPTRIRFPIMKILLLIIMGLVLTVVTALIGTLFLYAGWNWGVVPAIGGTHEVSLPGAFWLSLGLSAIGGMFKSSLTVNSKD